MKRLAFVLIVFTLASFTACSSNTKKSDEKVIVNDYNQPVVAFGAVKCHITRDIVIPFNAAIDKVLVREGEEVSQGQPLLKINIDDYNKQVDKKRIEIDNLKAQIDTLQNKWNVINNYLKSNTHPDLKKLANSLKNTEEDYETANNDLLKKKSLYDSGTLFLQEYERAVRDIGVKKRNIQDIKLSIETLKFKLDSEASELKNSVNQSKNNLSAAESEIRDMKEKSNVEFIKNENIICDISKAIVFDVKYNPGDIVLASSKILSLMDINSIYIEVNIDEQSIKNVKKDALVHIVPETDKSMFYTGKVSFISSMAFQKNGETTIPVQLSVNDADKLLIPNTNVEVKIFPD